MVNPRMVKTWSYPEKELMRWCTLGMLNKIYLPDIFAEMVTIISYSSIYKCLFDMFGTVCAKNNPYIHTPYIIVQTVRFFSPIQPKSQQPKSLELPVATVAIVGFKFGLWGENKSSHVMILFVTLREKHVANWGIRARISETYLWAA